MDLETKAVDRRAEDARRVNESQEELMWYTRKAAEEREREEREKAVRRVENEEVARQQRTQILMAHEQRMAEEQRQSRVT